MHGVVDSSNDNYANKRGFCAQLLLSAIGERDGDGMRAASARCPPALSCNTGDSATAARLPTIDDFFIVVEPGLFVVEEGGG